MPVVLCDDCRKRRYRDEGHAISAIMHSLKKGAPPLRFYKCPHNPTWFHITKVRKKH